MSTLLMYFLGAYDWALDNTERVIDWVILVVFAPPLALLMTANFDYAGKMEILMFLLIVAVSMLVLHWRFGERG